MFSEKKPVKSHDSTKGILPSRRTEDRESRSTHSNTVVSSSTPGLHRASKMRRTTVKQVKSQRMKLN
jgi:hypothetical protein